MFFLKDTVSVDEFVSLIPNGRDLLSERRYRCGKCGKSGDPKLGSAYIGSDSAGLIVKCAGLCPGVMRHGVVIDTDTYKNLCELIIPPWHPKFKNSHWFF